MTETNVFQLSQPGTFVDPLTEVLRNGARALLAQAIEAEVAALLSLHADKLTEDGRQRLVRHGHLPEREIMTGIGPVAVRGPRVRDRVGEGSERIRFSSAILPPYARRSKSLEVLIPILYLKGRLHRQLRGGPRCRQGRRRALSLDHWTAQGGLVGGACALGQARSLPEALCTLGSTASTCRPGSRTPRSAWLEIIGATPEGKKELVGLIDGMSDQYLGMIRVPCQ